MSARRLLGPRQGLQSGDSGRIAQIQANFLGGPSPTATVVGPSAELAGEKKTFAAVRRARWFD